MVSADFLIEENIIFQRILWIPIQDQDHEHDLELKDLARL